MQSKFCFNISLLLIATYLANVQQHYCLSKCVAARTVSLSLGGRGVVTISSLSKIGLPPSLWTGRNIGIIWHKWLYTWSVKIDHLVQRGNLITFTFILENSGWNIQNFPYQLRDSLISVKEGQLHECSETKPFITNSRWALKIFSPRTNSHGKNKKCYHWWSVALDCGGYQWNISTFWWLRWESDLLSMHAVMAGEMRDWRWRRVPTQNR